MLAIFQELLTESFFFFLIEELKNLMETTFTNRFLEKKTPMLKKCLQIITVGF